MSNIFTPYDSIGTEKKDGIQDGGCNFISSLFGQNKKYINITQLIIEMLESGEIEVAEKLLIRGGFIPDMDCCDSEGNNMLHSLAKVSCKSSICKKALIILTNNGKNKKALNHRNKYNKTPLHYIPYISENTDIMNYLLNNGADVISVVETEEVEPINNINIPISILTELSDHPTYDNITVHKPIRVSNTDIFAKPHNNENDRDDNFIDNIINDFNKNSRNDTLHSSIVPTDMDTVVITDKLINSLNPDKIQRPQNNVVSNVMNNHEHLSEPETDKFVEMMRTIMEGTDNMMGGRRKKQTRNTTNIVNGNRKMLNFSDLPDDAMAYSEYSSEGGDILSRLSRVVENKSSKYHDEALQKILSHLPDKTDLLLARAVKAIIYAEIKTEKPELGNLDKAMELLKSISSKKIKSVLKQEEQIQQIKKYITDKTKNKKNKT